MLERERRRQELQSQLEHRDGLGRAVRAGDSKGVRREIRELLTNWQGLLEARVVMQPRSDSTGRFYDSTATATYGRILTGIVRVTAMVPPG